MTPDRGPGQACAASRSSSAAAPSAVKPAYAFLVLEGAFAAVKDRFPIARPDVGRHRPDNGLVRDVDGDDGMDEETLGGTVAGGPEAGAAAIAAGEIDLGRILDGEDAPATRGRGGERHVGGKDHLDTDFLRRQEAMGRDLAIAAAANLAQHQRIHRHDARLELVAPFVEPDIRPRRLAPQTHIRPPHESLRINTRATGRKLEFLN